MPYSTIDSPDARRPHDVGRRGMQDELLQHIDARRAQVLGWRRKPSLDLGGKLLKPNGRHVQKLGQCIGVHRRARAGASLQGRGDGAQPPRGSFLRRKGAQRGVVPNNDRRFFQLRLLDRRPTLMETLSAHRNPLGGSYIVHGPMILVFYTVFVNLRA